MDRDYDLFERLPDGQIVWRAVLRGRDNATHKAQELAALSSNEFIAIHVPTREVIARMNVPRDN